MTQRTVLFPSSHSATNTRFTLPRIAGGALLTQRLDLELHTTAVGQLAADVEAQWLARIGAFGIIDTVEIFRNGTLLSTIGPQAGQMAAINVCTLSPDAAERFEVQTQGAFALQVNQMGDVPIYDNAAPGGVPADVLPTVGGSALIASSFGAGLQTTIGESNPVLPLNFLLALFAANPVFPLDDQIDIVITYDLTQFNSGGNAGITLDNTAQPRLYIETVAATAKKVSIAPWFERVHTVATLPALGAGSSDSNSIQVRIVNKNILGLFGLVQDPTADRNALFSRRATLGCGLSLTLNPGPVTQLNVTINGTQLYPRPISTPADQLREFALALNSDYISIPNSGGARGSTFLPANNADTTLSAGTSSPISALAGALSYIGFDCRRNGGTVDVDNQGVYFNINRTTVEAVDALEVHVWALCIAVA